MSVSQSQALHALTRGPKAACGRRPKPGMIATNPALVTCADCRAAIAADELTGR